MHYGQVAGPHLNPFPNPAYSACGAGKHPILFGNIVVRITSKKGILRIQFTPLLQILCESRINIEIFYLDFD